jgi:transglutaminase-like putative cysteine protease
MKFHIQHRLFYSYEKPVFLEPATLRLTPRQDSRQLLLHQHLEVLEPPAGMSQGIDADGNDAVVLWFEGERDHLQIHRQLVVETLRSNPFDWILTEPGLQRLPGTYSEALCLSLAPFLSRGQQEASVSAWATSLAAAVDHGTAAFLMHLADTIHRTFDHVGRLEGDPMLPAQTLAEQTGACRDTAMLFVAACRSQGLAARFVSGYSMHHPPEVTEQELHAWAEVYLPGAGWLGYDPSLGLAVGDGHVVLAVAPDHRLAAAVSGSYRGTGVASQLRYEVNLRASEAITINE